jgi:hypothetical protein
VRSLQVACPACFALYHVHFEGDDPRVHYCRECGAELQEISDIHTAHEYVDIGPDERSYEIRLWLDDDLVDRVAPEGWRHVTTAWEAIRALDTERVVELSLDHDIGDDEAHGRGIDVVEWICEQQETRARWLWPRDGISLHTTNPAGRDQMARAIRRYAGRPDRVRETVESGQLRFRFELP